MKFGAYDVDLLGAGDFSEGVSARDAAAIAAIAEQELERALPIITRDVGDPDADHPDASLRAAGIWFLTRLPEQVHGLARRRGFIERMQGRAGGHRAAPRVGDPWHPSWSDVEPATLPWWCWFRDGSAIWGPLGPAACVDIQALTAYVARLLLESHHGATVRRSSGSASAVDHRQPVIDLGDGREVGITARYAVMARRALDLDDPLHAAAVDVEQFVERHVHLTRPLPASHDEEVSAPYGLASVGGEHVVTFDDVIAHEQSARIDELARALATTEGVVTARREDRDVVILQAPELTDAEVRAVLDRLWEPGAPR